MSEEQETKDAEQEREQERKLLAQLAQCLEAYREVLNEHRAALMGLSVSVMELKGHYDDLYTVVEVLTGVKDAPEEAPLEAEEVPVVRES